MGIRHQNIGRSATLRHAVTVTQLGQIVTNVVVHGLEVIRTYRLVEELEHTWQHETLGQAGPHGQPVKGRVPKRNFGDRGVEFGALTARTDRAPTFKFCVTHGHLQFHVAPRRAVDQGQLKFNKCRVGFLFGVLEVGSCRTKRRRAELVGTVLFRLKSVVDTGSEANG